MTRTLPILTVAAAALAAGTLAAVPSGSAAAPGGTGPKTYALTDEGELVTFLLGEPRDPLRTVPLDGLDDGVELVGIDVRPADGRLYAVGSDSVLYRVGPKTGAATEVNELTVPLEGEQFGVDFNPTVDRLRIVSDEGQNLRHDPNTGGTGGTGTIADAPLNTPPTATPTTGIVAAAYTNNDASADTGTILYDLGATGDNLVTQTPANNGTLTAIGTTGVDLADATGFDIRSVRDGERTVLNEGYVTTGDRLYTVDLGTGLLTPAGRFATGTGVVDLAVKLAPTAG